MRSSTETRNFRHFLIHTSNLQHDSVLSILSILVQMVWYRPIITQEADGLVYAYILIWVAKSCGRRSTGFEGVFLDFYIYISQKYGPGPQKIGETRLDNAIYD